jgi:hypothetical protein
MLSNSERRFSKYGTFYDSLTLLTLVPSTSVRRQGEAETPYFIYRFNFRILLTEQNHRLVHVLIFIF